MTDINIYFGTPGAMITLIVPRGGISTTRSIQRSSFPTGGGGMQVWQTLAGKRTFALAYGTLDAPSFAALQAYEQGHNGVGPFAILDPGQRNMLTANQSAATSLTNDTSNFTVSGSGGTIASDAVLVQRGPRSLKWSFSVSSPATATLSLDSPSSSANTWFGVPVVSRPICFSLYARAAAGKPSITLLPKLSYLSVSGSLLGSTTGSATVATSAAWVQMFVAGTPTAGSAFTNSSVSASASTVTNTSVVNLDQFMLNEGSTPDVAWVPGTGVLPVKVMGLPDQQPWMDPSYRTGPGLTLQEIGS